MGLEPYSDHKNFFSMHVNYYCCLLFIEFKSNLNLILLLNLKFSELINFKVLKVYRFLKTVLEML